MRNEGRIAPKQVTSAPGVFRILYPTKTLMFAARTPGQLCATAIRSTNWSSGIHFLFTTTSFWIIEIIAYPPPSVKAPILKKVLKASQ